MLHRNYQLKKHPRSHSNSNNSNSSNSSNNLNNNNSSTHTSKIIINNPNISKIISTIIIISIRIKITPTGIITTNIKTNNNIIINTFLIRINPKMPLTRILNHR